MFRTLFAKIYLTVIASLIVVAVASGLFVRIGDDEEDRGWAGRRDAFIAQMLPLDADPNENAIVLRRLAATFDADITLFDASGRPIVTAGQPLPPDMIEGLKRRARTGPHHFATRLSDGRYIAARLKEPFWPPGRRRGTLAWLAMIAGVTGLAAWPVVRHLTRRLEALRRGVRDWGEGALDRRVKVKGRDEVAAVAATFNRAADRIEKLVESHRSLLANASHELRSPVARLRMAIELYEQQASEARREEILRNLAELDALVEEILLSSRLDHSEKVGLSDTVDLTAIVAEEGARNGVAVSGEPALIRGDARLLTRLARNLMQNALRHGAPPVVAEVRRRGGSVELSVRDHGPGIPAGEGERVFEAFYRPSGRGESSGGWGLGLALVRQIAERHGGSVRHEAPADGGACFVVSLPFEPPIEPPIPEQPAARRRKRKADRRR